MPVTIPIGLIPLLLAFAGFAFGDPNWLTLALFVAGLALVCAGLVQRYAESRR